MNGQDLKNSILQLAIQGKLIEQRDEEGTAKELLEKIKAEKEQLIKEKKIKKEKSLPEITEDEIPFEIPESWEWARIGQISALITKGTTPRGGNVAYLSDGIGFLRAENVAGIDKLNISNLKYIDEDTHNNFLKRSILQENDILITIAGTLGRTAIVKKEYLPLNANQAISIVRLVNGNMVNLLYLVYAINSPSIQILIMGQKKITAIPNLTLEIIENCIIPLPPLEEQKRIVAKIESLMPYIEQYDKAYTKVEALNKKFPEDMQKSILQYAIQGKLVEQRAEEGTAEELYVKIQEEKEKLIKEKKIKKEKPLPEISEEEIPFEIPESWKWVRLRNIVYNRGQKKPDKRFSYIDIGSIDNNNQRLNNNEQLIEPDQAPSRARKIVEYGDILYSTVRPYLHNMCIINKEFKNEPIASTGFAVMSCYKNIHNKFLFYFLLSPVFDAYANSTENSKGVAYPAINDERLYRAVVPLPPLQEQKRIVEKIEEMLPYCKQLIK